MPKLLIASCRRDFWSATRFAEVDDFRHLDLPGSGEGSGLDRATFVAALAGQRVMLLVHGYNNEQRDVLDSYRTIDDQMRLLGFLGGAKAAYDAIVGFAWPGGATGASFPFARERAQDSAPRLLRLLSDLVGAGVTIDLNTHSLGAVVVLEALTRGRTLQVRNAWNFAAAVDNESVELGERYHAATQLCQRFYVFHSRRDPVLRVWYRIGDVFDFDTALGSSGPEDPRAIMDHSSNVTVVNCKHVVTAHGGYRTTGQVWSFMQRELDAPGPMQFVTLPRTDAMTRAVFEASGGRLIASRATTPRRRAGSPGKRR